MKTKMFFALVAGLSFSVISSATLAQVTRVSWSTLDMGFAISNQANSAVKSAVGQTFVGKSQQANSAIESGFLVDTLLRGILLAVKEAAGLSPTMYSLDQNYPNPFNPTTNVQFSISNRQLTILKVYDVLGKEVATLVNEVKQPGTYTVKFDGSGLASGMYFYRLTTEKFSDMRKLMLVK